MTVRREREEKQMVICVLLALASPISVRAKMEVIGKTGKAEEQRPERPSE
jgi:hypothetical protein